MADHYAKLWASILDSSIWSASDTTRLVWITILVMKDRNGFVGASIDGIARRANISVEAATKAIAELEAPDIRSRSRVEDGRRIRPVERGWHVINSDYFQNLVDDEGRKRYERARKRDYRTRAVPKCPSNVPEMSASEAVPVPEVLPNGSSTSSKKRGQLEGFTEFWDAFGCKKSKGTAERAWRRLGPDADLAATIAAKAAAYHASVRDPQFHKHPATWLNARGWEDEDGQPGLMVPNRRVATDDPNYVDPYAAAGLSMRDLPNTNGWTFHDDPNRTDAEHAEVEAWKKAHGMKKLPCEVPRGPRRAEITDVVGEP